MKVTVIIERTHGKKLTEKKFDFSVDDYRDFMEWIEKTLKEDKEKWATRLVFKDQEEFPKDIQDHIVLKDYLFYQTMYFKSDLDEHIEKYGCLKSFFHYYKEGR